MRSKFLKLLCGSAGRLGHSFLTAPSFLQCLIDTEARRLLARRKLFESLEKLANDCLCRHEHECVISHPFAVEQSGVFTRSLERIGSQVVEVRRT
jgi:hypothetical protein